MANQTLALFLRALDNRYQHEQKSEFYAPAHVHRFSIVEFDARNGAEMQMQQIREGLRGPENARPRALFVNPGRESLLQGVARDSARLGVGWVSLNQRWRLVRGERFSSRDGLVTEPPGLQWGRWAVVAQNDSMAMGASRALSEGVRVKNHPRDPTRRGAMNALPPTAATYGVAESGVGVASPRIAS